MPSPKVTPVLSFTLIVAFSAVLSGCSGREPTVREAPAPPAKEAPASPREPADFSPPRPTEVREAIARVYEGAVILDGNGSPGFVAGDFNGDGLQDIAAVVRPARGMLAAINSELANWIVQDARKVVPPSALKPEPVEVKHGDWLLAVIHGHGPPGWRNPAARQTYLLRNAVGRNPRSVPADDLRRSMEGAKKLHSFSGDVIADTISGEAGFLYWTGAKYAWSPLR